VSKYPNKNKNYNTFESLSTEMECYKCNNFGHMAKDCRMIVPPRDSQQNKNIITTVTDRNLKECG
jgi:hypothetical protein